MILGNTKKIHFVGVGGIGMSGMAEFLQNHNFIISGSDIKLSNRIKHLKSIGIKIYIGHKKNNITNTNLIVYSSAVPKNNPELLQGKKNKIPVIKRAELLGELIKIKDISIAVAGTHGKTTTSSMIGNILFEAKLDPTIITGGIINKFNTNNISGSGDIIVVEADEFDRSFLSLNPTYTTVNNIDLEHLDIYKNIKDLKETFIKYANSIPFYGLVAISNDSKYAKEIKNKINRNIITFGIDVKSDIMAKNIKYKKNTSTFILEYKNKKSKIELIIPGKHNVYNALSAISICISIGVKIDHIKKGLKKFNGVRRRFEMKYYNKTKNINFIDDYAHHPSEIESTLESIKSGWPSKRIIAIFQPHLYSRTKSFYKEFAKSLLKSDINIITDIYPAREAPIKNVTSNLIIKELKKLKHKNTYLIKKESISKKINKIVLKNDLIITMGAGDIYKSLDEIYENIK